MLCRLCINDSDNFLNIFDTNGEELEIADILGRHFWFKPQPDDRPSTVICTICWLKVNDFHQFYITIEETQTKLNNQNVKKESLPDSIGNERDDTGNEFFESRNEFVDSGNDFIDPGNEFIDIKEESTEKKPSVLDDEDSESDALNPLCELDCNSVKDDTDDDDDDDKEIGGEKEKQSNDKAKDLADKSQPIPITNKLPTSPVRRKRKIIVDKLPAKKPKRACRKDVGAVDIDDNDTDEILPTKRTKRARRKDIVNTDVEHHDKVEKVKRTSKPKDKHGVKSKQEDDEMVKKYIQMNCELCAYVSEDYPTLRKHFRSQHSPTKAFIRCCNKKLFHRLEIIHHAYKHDNPEFFKCKICQKTFSEQSTLSRHMVATHAPEEDCNFHCDQCPKKFARQKQLEFHRNSHVPMEERAFICDQCPNSRFASKDLLNIHMCMRHKRAVNVCHVCAKEIRDKASFERHVSAHFEESGPKVKCPYDDCDHYLKDERNLGRHIRRVHTSEQKTMTCDECGRECKNKSALKKHKHRVHSGIVFTCEECNKTFKRDIYLREHMAQHTGEILYKCPFCTRTFNSNANMHAHKKKLHAAEWDNWRKTNNGSLQQLSRQLDKSIISTVVHLK